MGPYPREVGMVGKVCSENPCWASAKDPGRGSDSLSNEGSQLGLPGPAMCLSFPKYEMEVTLMAAAQGKFVWIK